MKTYTIKKKRHFSFPRKVKFHKRPKQVIWDVQFNANCNYIIKNKDGSLSNDQRDWNKLCGLFFSFFSTMENTAMIGWRYNVQNDVIELAPYYHVNGGRDMLPPMMEVKREEKFSVSLHIDYYKKEYKWVLKKDGFTDSHTMKFTHKKKWCTYINFYFGGNQKSPKKISVKMASECIK
ncbi:MAG: hypothetical protein ACI94Y_003987 [Maribacter sp.]|jgi:hypothetical protein